MLAEYSIAPEIFANVVHEGKRVMMVRYNFRYTKITHHNTLIRLRCNHSGGGGRRVVYAEYRACREVEGGFINDR